MLKHIIMVIMAYLWHTWKRLYLYTKKGWGWWL